MSIFTKIVSIFKTPTNEKENIIQNALDNKSQKLDISKPVDKIVVTNEDLKVLEKNPYTFNFTFTKFSKIMSNPQEKEWFDAIYNVLPKYGINTPERVAGFFAQTFHESLDYTVLEENLYYSAAGLRKTFPKYFKSVAAASSYAKKPQKIANYVYGNRMGNGNVASGDGYKFRGRGPIQVTGKNNYTLCSKFLFNDLRLISDPDLIIKDKKVCIMSACWYWSYRNINRYCDKKDIIGMTKAINGGTNGLSDRKVRFNKYLTILK
nr:MAG: putative chitinase [Caudoviricetes sp.]